MNVPNYYYAFRCIADRCRHTCCKGWEIDVDEETYFRYQTVPGPLGDRIRASVSEEDTPHFITGEGDRCPFLREDGLCELIRSGGEELLCEICRMHPRYVNDFCGREETGLGLCCEEAVRIALTYPEPITLLCEDEPEESDPFEEKLYSLRSRLTEEVQQEQIPLPERIARLNAEFGAPPYSREKWKERLFSLEVLDPAWHGMIARIGEEKSDLSAFSRPLSRLAAVFLHRYFPRIREEEEIAGIVRFAVLSCEIVSAICRATEDCTLEDLLETVRRFSSEIEYSEENTAALLSFCTEDES